MENAQNAELNELRELVKKYSKNNRSLSENLKNTLDEKQILSERINEYEKMLVEMEDSIQNDSNIKSLNKLKNENKKLKNEINTLNDIILSLQEENQNYKEKLKHLSKN